MSKQHDFQDNKNNLEIEDIEVKEEVKDQERTQNNIDKQLEPDQSNPYQEKFEVPLSLKKTFICSVTLLVVGLTLFILGFISEVAEVDPGRGITFWVLGGVVTIPGGYYSYQFYKAKKSHNPDERSNILSEIPEL
jgi:hypothetical protein